MQSVTNMQFVGVGSFLVKQILSPWKHLQELNHPRKAEETRDSLLHWIGVIEENVHNKEASSSSVQVIDKMPEGDIDEMRELVSLCRKAIYDYEELDRRQKRFQKKILNKIRRPPHERKFVREVKDAEQKLASAVKTLKTAVDAPENIHGGGQVIEVDNCAGHVVTSKKSEKLFFFLFLLYCSLFRSTSPLTHRSEDWRWRLS